jgi:outer membrane lipoprotein-sorting protein
MTRYTLATVLSVAVLSAAPGSAAVQQTADQVVEKHLSAMGGRAALSKLTSRRATGNVTISTPGGDISGPIEIFAKAPNKTRAVMQLDLSALGVTEPMNLDQKFDGTTGWTLNSLQGDNQITGNQLENMRNNTFPSPLLTYKAAGSKLELLPKETVADKELVVIRLTPKTGSAYTMYLDSSTYLLVKAVAKVVTAEMGELEQTNQPSDYRDVGGLKVPFQVINATSVQTVTIRLDKVEHNVAIDDAIFSVKTPRP